MNTVTVNQTQNTVSVDETTLTVTVTEGQTTSVQVVTEGPQGPAGTGIDLSSAVDDSLVYFHQSSGTLKVDSTTTKLTLVDGGNF